MVDTAVREGRDLRVGAWAGRLLGASGFLPVWLVVAGLVLVASIAAPQTLSQTAFSEIWPFTTFLAVAALGQMLIVMTGGIDLSVPGVITMVGTVLLGVSRADDERLVLALAASLVLAAAVGLINGLLVSLAGLNPLVVTLSTGQVVLGLTAMYRGGIAQEARVPASMASWAGDRFLGVSYVFCVGLVVTMGLAVVVGRTRAGRQLQLVGANRSAAFIAGIAVRRTTVMAYAGAGLLYGIAGLLLAAFIRTPTLDVGAPYLLGPIAAVVIAGASLAGGVASATSTWAAAFALTFLATMLRVVGLPSALQFIVFGVAIAVGMVISGDRIVGMVGRLTLRQREAAARTMAMPLEMAGGRRDDH